MLQPGYLIYKNFGCWVEDRICRGHHVWPCMHVCEVVHHANCQTRDVLCFFILEAFGMDCNCFALESGKHIRHTHAHAMRVGRGH